ncbi:MAG TPA: 6-phosphogluconolactonase [Caulobacteraceae bacterium]|nr:6-phosphogluconolactonase [Caulobacteraceae bacterium]
MGRPVVEVFDSPRAAAEEAADAIAAALRDAVLERGAATFIATGGRTPAPVYDQLARADLPWDKVSVTLTDERWVDPLSPDSNERLVRDHLFVERGAAAAFAPLKTAHATPAEAVEEVCGLLAPVLPADVVLLGMGEDGHVASLFPGGRVEAEGLAVGVETGAPQPRLSLTFQALEPRRLTVLLISGEAKRRVLEHGEGLPVHRLLSRAQAPERVLWSP